jgi:hypothetical protein
MITEPHLQAQFRWPREGRHILAQYDEKSIWVYQAYCPEIADFAVTHQAFGGNFSFNRMSWIKPNFLWMMYRSGWASKPGQERILRLRLTRDFFDSLLLAAVASTYDKDSYRSEEEWQTAVSQSEVRLQWDPDHDPIGRSLPRRAVQLGLRGETLRKFASPPHLLAVEDVTPFVISQRENKLSQSPELLVAREEIYLPALPLIWR